MPTGGMGSAGARCSGRCCCWPVPHRPLHDPQSAAARPVCGQDLNDAQWPHEHPSPDPDGDNPFSRLKVFPK
ncbi:MAG: hypothetical protein WKG07_13050 [Hymenobacter sp.]